MPAARALYGLAMGTWFGVMLHFTALLTPVLSRRLPAEFPRITEVIFPPYLRAGEALAALALLAALAERAARTVPSRRWAGARLALALAALALALGHAEVVHPAVRAARGTAGFGALHGLSLALNGLSALAALAGTLLAHAGTPGTGNDRQD